MEFGGLKSAHEALQMIIDDDSIMHDSLSSIELDSDSEIDLTCTSPENTVVDLTTRRRRRAPDRSAQTNNDVDIVELNTTRRRAPTPAAPPVDRVPLDIQERNRGVEEAEPVVHLKCPICLEALKDILRDGGQMRSTSCGHVFCERCIMMSLRSSKHCPTCRKTLSKTKIHPLFLPITT